MQRVKKKNKKKNKKIKKITANSFEAFARQVLSAAYVKSTADGAIDLVNSRYKEHGFPGSGEALQQSFANYLAAARFLEEDA